MPDRRRGRVGMTYIEAKDLALRYHAKLPAAEQQGVLAQAIAEADRYAGVEEGSD